MDIGEKRIGVALSDRTWMISTGLDVINHKKFSVSAAEIHKLYKDNNACAIVIGHPKNMDGTDGPRSQSIHDFGRNLVRTYPDINYILWDERLSTVAVETVLIEADLTRKKRKTVVDKLAATYILQGFLDRIQCKISQI